MKTMDIQRAAFFDELVEIEKSAGFVRDLGNDAMRVGRWAGRTTVKGGDNAGRTLGAMLSPRRAMNEGMEGAMNSFQNVGMLSKGYQAWNLAKGFKDALPDQDPTGAGRSKLHRTLRAVGGQAGGLIGLPFGLPGNVIGVGVGNKVGDVTGRVVDKIRRYRPPEQPIPIQGY